MFGFFRPKTNYPVISKFTVDVNRTPLNGIDPAKFTETLKSGLKQAETKFDQIATEIARLQKELDGTSTVIAGYMAALNEVQDGDEILASLDAALVETHIGMNDADWEKYTESMPPPMQTPPPPPPKDDI